MKILIDDEAGRLTLCPSNMDETEQLRFIPKPSLTSRVILYYQGREDGSDGRVDRLNFSVKGRSFPLLPTGPEDRDNLCALRDTVFFGSGRLVLRQITEDQETGLAAHFTASQCKICGRDITKRGQVEFRTCGTCSKLCTHSWTQGYIHGGDAGSLAIGQFCTKCGVGNKDVPLVKIFESAEYLVWTHQKVAPD